MISEQDLRQYRKDTPGSDGVVHLNNAGAGLMPATVLKTVVGHLVLEAEIGGYEARDAVDEELRAVYSAVGELINAAPHNIALMEHATAAYNTALSAIPFESGDLIVTTRNDYVSNQIAFLALERRFGVEVLRVPDTPEGGMDVSAMEAVIRRRLPKLVAITHVPTNSGLVQPVEEVGPVCSSLGVLFLVDACQSVGQMPVDVARIECDFLSATGRKFLRGPRGTGFLYVGDRAIDKGLEPLFPDLHGADWIDDNLYQAAPDASRFESWESSIALQLGLGEATRYATSVGVEAAYAQIVHLADRLRVALQQVPGAQTLDRGHAPCGIVTVAVEAMAAPEISRVLREKGVNTSYVDAGSAVIDFREKDVDSAVRFSPHYYNTEDEIDHAVELFEAVVTGKAP